MVAADERFEIVAPHPLNLLCLRLRRRRRAPTRDRRANATRQAWFTRTVLDGHPALRFSIGARTTERRHVEAAWELLQRSAP